MFYWKRKNLKDIQIKLSPDEDYGYTDVDFRLKAVFKDGSS